MIKSITWQLFQENTVKCATVSSRGQSRARNIVTEYSRKIYNQQLAWPTCDCWPGVIPNGWPERWSKIRRILAGLQKPNKKCIITEKPVHYVLRWALWTIVRQPQHERKYDTAFCHALVSRTDRKGKGEGGCRQETYKKRMALLCSRDRKHGATFMRISLLEEIQGGVEFHVRLHVRKKVFAAFSSNWGNLGYTTNALRNSGYIHVDSQPRADQVSGKRYSCPVPNSPSWKLAGTRSKAF
jgi:hypothetical protein